MRFGCVNVVCIRIETCMIDSSSVPFLWQWFIFYIILGQPYKRPCRFIAQYLQYNVIDLHIRNSINARLAQDQYITTHLKPATDALQSTVFNQ